MTARAYFNQRQGLAAWLYLAAIGAVFPGLIVFPAIFGPIGFAVVPLACLGLAITASHLSWPVGKCPFCHCRVEFLGGLSFTSNYGRCLAVADRMRFFPCCGSSLDREIDGGPDHEATGPAEIATTPDSMDDGLTARDFIARAERKALRPIVWVLPCALVWGPLCGLLLGESLLAVAAFVLGLIPAIAIGFRSIEQPKCPFCGAHITSTMVYRSRRPAEPLDTRYCPCCRESLDRLVPDGALSGQEQPQNR